MRILSYQLRVTSHSYSSFDFQLSTVNLFHQSRPASLDEGSFARHSSLYLSSSVLVLVPPFAEGSAEAGGIERDEEDAVELGLESADVK